MKILIVYAHEEPHSFNAAMKNVALRVFQEQGHLVTVSDLYRMRFKAVADGEDFLERRDRHTLKRQVEERAALDLGTLAHDIVVEQQKLREADLLIFQFPLWWFSMPSILKGWVDRVLTMGFAYGGGKWYDQGGLRGRRAMLALTTGSPRESFSPEGLNGDMDQILYPIQHGILYFCGFEVLPPFVAYGPAHLGDEDRKSVLADYEKRLQLLEALDPIPFHPLAHYDEALRLRPEFRQPGV
jgi:NAD(P)H dehydrogenase (quinone)